MSLEKYLKKEGKPGFKSAMKKDKKKDGESEVIKNKDANEEEIVSKKDAKPTAKKKREYMED